MNKAKRKNDPRNSCSAVGAGWGHLYKHESKNGPYWTGWVAAPEGLVGVYAQLDSLHPAHDHTRLTFVRDGFCYERTIPRVYSERYTKTLAKRFAAEIAEAHRIVAAQARYEELEQDT